MRICIITPSHLSLNPRVVKEASALGSAGHQVSVVHGVYTEWGRRADLRFGDRPWTVAAALPFGPSSPRSVRIRQIARAKSSQLLAKLGVTTSRVARNAMHHLSEDLVKAAAAVVADLYIAHYPSALPAAAAAARRHGAQYAYDAEDFHLGDWPDRPEYDGDRKLVRAIEGQHLPGCAFVTAASAGIAAELANAYRIPTPTVLLNVFSLGEAPACDYRPAATLRPSLYWFSQTIGPDRGLECAVRAIGISRSGADLFLRGNVSAAFRQQIFALARSCGVAERIHLLPLADPREMVRLAAQFDLGLVSETGHTLNRKIALTNKLFTYVLAGVPTIMSDIPAHRHFAESTPGAGSLYETDNPLSLASIIDALLEDRAALASQRVAVFALGQSCLNWEAESAKLVYLVAGTQRAMPIRGEPRPSHMSR